MCVSKAVALTCVLPKSTILNVDCGKAAGHDRAALRAGGVAVKFAVHGCQCAQLINVDCAT